MKKYLVTAIIGLGLVGCVHHDAERGGTYDQSGTYQGGVGTQSDWERGTSSDLDMNSLPSGAERTPGANEHSPPPVLSPNPSPSY